MIKLRSVAERRSHLALALMTIGVGALVLMMIHAQFSKRSSQLADHAALAAELGLTDLALFTEARYTRHPSQADLFTPFQDHPMSFDHFPSGSLVSPQQSFGGKKLFVERPDQ